MKTLQKLLIFVLVGVTQPGLYATLPDFLQVELRTTGADTNGGAFYANGGTVSCTGGTDYSQQNAAQVAINNTTVTAVTAGVAAIITITGYTPATTDKCNIVQIISGTNMTAGFYMITAVAGQTWTLDRNVSTGVGANIVANMGGGVLTLSKAFTLVDTNSADSDTIWMKSGTYTVTTATTLPTSAESVNVHGYQTTHGDDTGTRPLYTTATNSTILLNSNSSNLGGWIINNVSFSNTAGTRDDCFFAPGGNATNLTIINSVLDGCKIGINGNWTTGYLFSSVNLYKVEIKNCTSHGYENSGSGSIIGSHIHHNGGTGVAFGGSAGATNVLISINHSVIDNNTGSGFVYTLTTARATAVIMNSDLVSNTLSGITLANADQRLNIVMSNIILDSNSRYGIEDTGTAGRGQTSRFNTAFRNNTLGATLKMPVEASDITLSATPFVAAGSNNFALNSTTGGGAALKAVGFPGIIPTAGTGYLDVGALQSQGAASGGANSSYVQ